MLALPSAAFALPSAAFAKGHHAPPPGNSGVAQYLETFPTDSGARATRTVNPAPAGGRASSATQASSTTPLASSAARALNRRGSNGRQVAALVGATAPRSQRRSHTHVVATSGGSGSSTPPSGGSGTPNVLKAITGASGDGGSGFLLPLILVLCAAAPGVIVLWRRRANG